MNGNFERWAAAREGAAVGPIERRGLLRMTGKTHQDFLHRMSTQRVRGLAEGSVAHLAFLNVKGHVLAEGLAVLRSKETLLNVEPMAAGPLRAHLVKYVIMDDVKIEDVSAGFEVVPVLGERGVLKGRERAGGNCWANPRRGVPALDILLPAAEGERFREGLLAEGATPLAQEDLEGLRVLAGLPRFGAEVDESRLPMEAALLASAVSFDKGCYLGQEVVLRGTIRGQIQKGLVQLALPAGVAPGALLTSAGREVGVVTSAAETPEGRLGLGYLRRAHWKVGERLATEGGEAEVRRVLVEER